MFEKTKHVTNFVMRAKALPRGIWMTRQRISEILAERGEGESLRYLCSGQKELAQYIDALVRSGSLEAKTGKEVAVLQSKRDISTRDVADLSDWIALQGEDDRIAYDADRLLHARRLGNSRAESLGLVESVQGAVAGLLVHAYYVESDGKILIPTEIDNESDLEYRRIYFKNATESKKKRWSFEWLG